MKSKEKQWRRHIDEGCRHPGGIESYCRSKGLRSPSFHYWKKKLNKSLQPVPVAPAFVPVSVTPVRKEEQLPSPEWVAQFVWELSRRTR